MRKRFAVLLLLCATLLAADGCSKTHKVEIESDTCWTGTVNYELSISDCGNATYKIVGRLQCVRLTRSTASGYLRVRIDNRPWAETTPSITQVQVCD